MAAFACKGCVAPKRYPGCHGSCPDYLADRAEYDRLKAIYDREQRVIGEIYSSRSEKVYKAMKDRRNKKV